MKKLLKYLITILALTSSAFADEKGHASEITEEARNVSALKALNAYPNTVQIYAKGLVCESCGIGVRKKLQKLKFVDTSKPQKGIVMNVQSQLVSVTLKDGVPIDIEAIKKAIKGAGYDPITLYEMDGKKLKSSSLAE